MKQKILDKKMYTKKNEVPPHGHRETPEAQAQEERFFKLFGIILVVLVFYLPFISNMILHTASSDSGPMYF